jgi:hypothetical protein
LRWERVLFGEQGLSVLDPLDLLAIATIAGYAANALARAELLQHRTDVAYQLQQAMLTEQPTSYAG